MDKLFLQSLATINPIQQNPHQIIQQKSSIWTKKLSPPLSTDIYEDIDDTSINNWVHRVLNSAPPDSDDESELSDINDYKADTEQLHQSSLQLLQLYDTSQPIITTNHESHSQHPDRQSFLIKTHTKPNLFRPDTNTPWDTIDIEDLQDEMTQELQSMVLNHTQNSIKSDDCVYEGVRTSSLFINHHRTNTMLTLDHGQLSMERASNLIQTLSHDWDSEDMEIEGHQMMKHLNHLKNENGDNHS